MWARNLIGENVNLCNTFLSETVIFRNPNMKICAIWQPLVKRTNAK